MKRVLVFALALLALAGCGESGEMDVPEGGFSVGDMCTLKGRQGIVVRVNTDRKSGLVMSLDETQCSWDDAVVWASSFGGDWRLPTVQELQAISNIREKLDAVLSEYGMPVLGSKDYWSSEEHDSDSDVAWFVDMYGGRTGSNYKNYTYYVRAVSAF